MIQLRFISEITCFENKEEWELNYSFLIQKAIEASRNAYAPYSEFYVGAAVELEDGTVVLGSNQENAAYPSGLCAERVALFTIGHQHPNKKIIKIAITANSTKHETNEPVIPCGACMQVMSEFEHRQKTPIAILLHGNNGKVYESVGLKNLMPLTFELK